MAQQLPRLCQQLLLPEGVPCWNPDQSERILESLSPLFFCSSPFQSCAMTTGLAVVQFPSAVRELRCCSLLPFFFFFLWHLPVLRQILRVVCVMLAIAARKLLRKVSVGFLLCTVVTLAEKEQEVQGKQAKGSQNMWILWSSWNSLLSFLIFSTPL